MGMKIGIRQEKTVRAEIYGVRGEPGRIVKVLLEMDITKPLKAGIIIVGARDESYWIEPR